MRLQGKCALVVGAGSVGAGWGNGRATTAVLMREGATVFGADRDADALAVTAEMVADHGTLETQTCDITNTQEIDALITAAHQAMGRIDILVNNVGGSSPGDIVRDC